MKQKLKDLSLQVKMVIISLAANLMVCAVNIVMLFGIGEMSDRLDTVYRDNVYLTDLSSALERVQDSMTEYLNTKTSDALEEYYRSEQVYNAHIMDLRDQVEGDTFNRMQRNIRTMSERYLEEVSQTIEAKRGRNVEKYRARYEEATRLYGYIRTYIFSLNTEQFTKNSKNYSIMLQAFERFETISTLVMIFVIITNIVLIMQLTYNLVKPLKALKENADEVALGNFDIEPLPVYSADEIGVVTNAFNQMIVSIQNYIVQIKRSMETEKELRERELKMETHLKDAQLKYLQAQINPHFLFNTLNAGAQLAMMEGADKTYEYVQRMSEFFRYNVKKGNQTVTIREEIELVDNYIYILNVRFSGDIHYEKQIDRQLLDIEMPSMILQPIVENCVNHGINEMMGEGRIVTKVYRIDDVACISISDNGIGMSEDQIARLLSPEASGDKTVTKGIGIDNVIARLKLFTESDDSFTILSDGEGKGTEFIVYLKLKERDDV